MGSLGRGIHPWGGGSIPGPVPQGMRGALRLVRFRGAAGGGPRLGLEEAPGGDLVDLSAAEPELPRSMREFLEIGPRGLELARRCVRPRATPREGGGPPKVGDPQSGSPPTAGPPKWWEFQTLGDPRDV